jgi:hypothetical protein
VKDLVVSGSITGISAEGWTNVDLPDEDNLNWAPVSNAHYFINDLTEERTLTLSQASINALYPDAPDKTIVRFDFLPAVDIDVVDPLEPGFVQPFRPKRWNLHILDVFLFQDETSNEPESDFEGIDYCLPCL